MQLKRLLSALNKNQIKVEQKDTWGNGNVLFIATKNDRSLCFYENGKGSGEVTHLTYQSPQTDAMTDCFCDSYFSTIKGAVKFFD